MVEDINFPKGLPRLEDGVGFGPSPKSQSQKARRGKTAF